MRVVFATSNPHKIREVRSILGAQGIEVWSLDDVLGHPPELAPLDFGGQPEPEEDGDTFEDNARIKARAYAGALGRPCLAEDSGLEVDALGGRPGVHSARYSGIDGSRTARDRANNDKLLVEMAVVPDDQRSVRFVCSMCLADPTGKVLAEARGVFEGVIARAPRGEGGFGYDPLLYLADVDKCSAELSAQEKNARSHRGDAARKLARALAELQRGRP